MKAKAEIRIYFAPGGILARKLNSVRDEDRNSKQTRSAATRHAKDAKHH